QGSRAGAEARGLRDGGPRRAAAGHADPRGRRGHLRDALADARPGHRDGLRPGRARPARNRADDRRARPAPQGPHRPEADLSTRGVTVSAESYPDELRYHPEHDWARIEGDTATLGITWYGQDALGELVHYEPPDAGATISKDGAYGEVESVKAVSDLIAPLSGEVLEVNQKVVDAPETVNEDPYGDGWLVKIRIADPAEADALMDAEAYKTPLATL